MPTPRTKPKLDPRGLDRIQAAMYCGFGLAEFDEYVAEGEFPKGRRTKRGELVWCRRKLDAALDCFFDEGGNPWDAS